MAYTDLGKEQVQSVGIASVTRYLSAHLANDNELDFDHGYARRAITPSEMSVSSAGVVTVTAPLDFYTADDDNAQDADKVALYMTMTGDNQLMEPENLTTDVGAPTDGQTLRLTSLTFNP